MNSKVETTVMDMLKSLKEDKEAMFRPMACLKDTPKDMHTVAKRFGEMSGLVTISILFSLPFPNRECLQITIQRDFSIRPWTPDQAEQNKISNKI